MTKFIGQIVIILGVTLLAGCSGSTPGSMTASKPRSGSEDPAMDPFERVGAQMKEKQTSSAPPQTAPAAAAVSAPKPVVTPAPAAPASKAAQ